MFQISNKIPIYYLYFLDGKIKLKTSGEKITKISTTKEKCLERKSREVVI